MEKSKPYVCYAVVCIPGVHGNANEISLDYISKSAKCKIGQKDIINIETKSEHYIKVWFWKNKNINDK